ncbi:hypothetical protein GCM10010339_67700 [Streptomyces alanosinicus]|uniref:Uncharacterized protein n=1 Tax=Streptomyces alanosinicus TaxID=68171 RepID=A0A918YNM8_9ACTN|nr:hypothetical protein GCM10010339_67700 [Streptomyces alanosinicus]
MSRDSRSSVTVPEPANDAGSGFPAPPFETIGRLAARDTLMRPSGMPSGLDLGHAEGTVSSEGAVRGEHECVPSAGGGCGGGPRSAVAFARAERVGSAEP